MGYKFIKTPYVSEFTGTDGQTITVEQDQDSTLPQMLQAFSDFLRASGYSFDGSLEIVNEVGYDENESSGC